MMEKKRVVFYGRVSTQSEEQLSAFSNQMTWYEQLLGQHPEWTVVGQYEDPGVTGTSVRKRRGFQQMMEDGIRRHQYDLIVTTETKRFARNTVDALSCVRLLKEHGIEVFFVNDAIHTISDRDGELRLSIMATIAQEESRKISENVKAGQRISRQKGILRGNGNILGYRRTGRNQYEIDPQQAAAVKNIYQWYLEGKSIRNIGRMLEQQGFCTSTGKRIWRQEVIAQILRNPFYTGRQLQLQRVSDGYLTQKRKRNSPEAMEYIAGAYEPIISAEMFEEVQRLKNARRSPKGDRGKKEGGSVWCGRYICSCGRKMVRRSGRSGEHRFFCPSRYEKNGSGEVHGGTWEDWKETEDWKRTADWKGTEDWKVTADWKATAEWKLDMIAFYVIRDVWDERESDLEQAWKAIAGCLKEENGTDGRECRAFKEEIQKLERRRQILIDMRIDGELSKEDYLKRREECDTRISVLKKTLSESENSGEAGKETAGNGGEANLENVRTELEHLTDLTGPKLAKELVSAFIWRIVRTSEHGYKVFLRHGGMGEDIPKTDPVLTGYGRLWSLRGSMAEWDAESQGAEKEAPDSCGFLMTRILTYGDAVSYRAMSGRRVMKNRWEDLTVYIYSQNPMGRSTADTGE